MTYSSRGVVFDFSCSFEDNSTLILVFKESLFLLLLPGLLRRSLHSFLLIIFQNTATSISTTNTISTASNNPLLQSMAEVVGATIQSDNDSSDDTQQLATVKPLSAR